MPLRLRITLCILLLIATAICAAAQSQSNDAAEQRVDAILKQMTLTEKIDLLGGVDGFYTRGVPRLNVPRFKMADGPLGVRNYGPATAFAGGIALTATWDTKLVEQVGTQLGRDARAKGVHFLLGPGVNIYRAPMNGRNFEYFGEDPFLASRIAVAYIRGVQTQGVSATIKHYMGNNSEFARHNVDSIIDERTMREIYLPTFEAAVKEANVGAIMDSYNLVNGAHATQNATINVDVAKRDWGFRGIIMSDWSATYDAVAAANGGLDLEMPSPEFMNRKNLEPALASGAVTEATIDDKVRRILRVGAEMGWLDRDQTDLSIPRFNQEARQVALQAARESAVLLKNSGPLLPLDKKRVKSILVVGPDAYPAVPVGGGSARVEPFAAVSFLEGISNYLGQSARTYYARGLPTVTELAQQTAFLLNPDGQPGLKAEYFSTADLSGTPVVTRTEQHINFGEPSRALVPPNAQSERWSGYYVAPVAGDYDVVVSSTGEAGGQYRLFLDDKPVFDNWRYATALQNWQRFALTSGPHKIVLEKHGRTGFLGGVFKLGIAPAGVLVQPEAKQLAAEADAVIVCAGFDPQSESEGGDRTFRLPFGQDELISAISAVNPHTIVVVTSGGAVDMSQWLDRVTAVLETWYSGQEGGTALAEILFGEVGPSGRLPVSFERRWEDNPAHDYYYPQPGTDRVEYKEGVFVGYRGYQKNNAKPLFPFGFGLSYTTFAYDHLHVNGKAVDFDVANTGKREGAEVAEIYISPQNPRIPRPIRELKGFARVELRPGETRHVEIKLDDRAFAYWDSGEHHWRTDPGLYTIEVGRSSAEIELKAAITLPATQR